MASRGRRLTNRIPILITLLIIVAIGVTAWYFFRPSAVAKIDYNLYHGAPVEIAYPEARFAVISDLHYYNPALGSSGLYFDTVLASDRKLLLESEELLRFASAELLAADLDFLIVSGDLTKDGELICHQGVAQRLQELQNAGLPVYVIPGNHDIDNFNAVEFEGDQAFPVTNISATEFIEIYAGMGFASALYRDNETLSYVVEPIPGLWLLAIDSCRYAENSPDGDHAITEGRIAQEQADWLATILSEALRQQKAVIAFMHHGVVEHWPGQSKLHPMYLVEDYQHFGEFLASYQVQFCFTGHYHAQNIARDTFNGRPLYDIETGSLVTYPCPVRYCQLSPESLTINSVTIGDRLRPGTDFAANADLWVRNMIAKEARETLYRYKVSVPDADYIAAAVSAAFSAHYSGDVDPAQRPPFDTNQLSIWGKIIYMTQGYVLNGLWTEPQVPDNDVTIPIY